MAAGAQQVYRLLYRLPRTRWRQLEPGNITAVLDHLRQLGVGSEGTQRLLEKVPELVAEPLADLAAPLFKALMVVGCLSAEQAALCLEHGRAHLAPLAPATVAAALAKIAVALEALTAGSSGRGSVGGRLLTQLLVVHPWVIPLAVGGELQRRLEALVQVGAVGAQRWAGSGCVLVRYPPPVRAAGRTCWLVHAPCPPAALCDSMLRGQPTGTLLPLPVPSAAQLFGGGQQGCALVLSTIQKHPPALGVSMEALQRNLGVLRLQGLSAVDTQRAMVSQPQLITTDLTGMEWVARQAVFSSLEGQYPGQLAPRQVLLRHTAYTTGPTAVDWSEAACRLAFLRQRGVLPREGPASAALGLLLMHCWVAPAAQFCKRFSLAVADYLEFRATYPGSDDFHGLWERAEAEARGLRASVSAASAC